MVELLKNRFFMTILPALLKSLSPGLVRALQAAIIQLRSAASATSNPWDDIFVEVLDGVVSDIASEEE